MRGPGNASLIDGLLDADVAVSRALGLDVADGRESLLQRSSGGDGGPRRAKREAVLQQLRVVAAFGRILALQKDVRMRIDQPRHHGHAGEVDDAARHPESAVAAPTLSMRLPRMTMT